MRGAGREGRKLLYATDGKLAEKELSANISEISDRGVPYMQEIVAGE